MKQHIRQIVLTVIGVILVQSIEGARKHPVRQEIIDEIKHKTSNWTPLEMHENDFRDVPMELMDQKFGYLGQSTSGNFIN